MCNPKISIIVPSFNQGEFLEETILSVINQSYKNFELIIIDGASTDSTLDVIKKYENYLAYWVSEPDRGQSHAINKGLEKVTGDVFNWLNSDDYLEPGALEQVAQSFISDPRVLVVAGFCRLFSVSPDFSIISRIGVRETAENSIVDFWMNQPSTFYATKAVKQLGGVTEDLHYCMDLELWFRFLSKYGVEKVQLSNYLFSHFRHHESSKTTMEEKEFIKETRILYACLSQSLGFPSYITNFFSKSEDVKLNPEKTWKVDALDRKQMAYELAKKYMGEAVRTNSSKVARWFLKQLIRKEGVRFNRQFMGWTKRAFVR